MTGQTAAIALWASLAIALAQVPEKAPTPATPQQQPEDRLGRQTPYGCVKGFLLAAGREEYPLAAQYLDARTTPAKAEDLARRLGSVLDLGLSGRLDAISRSPEGDLRDALSPNRDRVGSVKTSSGSYDIFLTRVRSNDGSQIWLFSSDTLRNIPRLFEEVSEPEFVQRLPEFLRDRRFLFLPLWRWAGIIIGIALAFLLSSLITRALLPILRPALHLLTGEQDDVRLTFLKRPIRLILLAIALHLLASVSRSLLGRSFWMHIAIAAAVVGVAWLMGAFSNIVSDLKTRKLIANRAAGKVGMVVLGRRLFKILITLITVPAVLHIFGVNITALLAGLGLGGVALALAAQKTLENLLAGVSLMVREAVRVGDMCQIGGYKGVVEDIGFGSTRLRTLDRTVVSVPNSQVAQASVENIELRDKFWIHHTVPLRYDTSPEEMRAVLSGIADLLRGVSRVESDSIRIRFIGFGPSSLTVEVFAYIRAVDYAKFLSLQEDLLLQIMEIIAASGAKIALPSQITYIKPDSELGGAETNVRHA